MCRKQNIFNSIEIMLTGQVIYKPMFVKMLSYFIPCHLRHLFGLVQCYPKLVTRGQASGRVTRNSQQLNIPLFRTATGQRSFQYRAVSLWNSLDKDLKLSKNHEVFRRKLKHILRDT